MEIGARLATSDNIDRLLGTDALLMPFIVLILRGDQQSVRQQHHRTYSSRRRPMTFSVLYNIINIYTK